MLQGQGLSPVLLVTLLLLHEGGLDWWHLGGATQHPGELKLPDSKSKL